MAVSETIQEILEGIDTSQYGRDMRQYIHKGIEKCYEEGSAGETDLEARTRLDDIEANLAPKESTSTASQAYAVGDYLLYNGTLYKVTAAIGQGETIEVGTNVEDSTITASMQKADESAAIIGTWYTTFFNPSTKSGTQTGSTLTVGAGRFIVMQEFTLPASGSANADFIVRLQNEGSTRDDTYTLTNTDWRYANSMVYEFTDNTASFTPIIKFNSGGGNVTFPSLSLNIIRVK